MRQQPTLSTLSEALVWAEQRWDRQRPVPSKLHDARTTEGELGAPRFSHAFAAALDSSEADRQLAAETSPCQHPGITEAIRQAGGFCRMCAIYDREGKVLAESGVYERRVERYRYPMTLALGKLSNALRPRRHPHALTLILALAGHGWSPYATARSLGLPFNLAEALFMRAIRQLHARYQEAPTPGVSYVDMSESQRNAIEASLTAA